MTDGNQGRERNPRPCWTQHVHRRPHAPVLASGCDIGAIAGSRLHLFEDDVARRAIRREGRSLGDNMFNRAISPWWTVASGTVSGTVNAGTVMVYAFGI